MAPFSLSPASKRCLRKPLVLVLVLIVMPLITSHWKIHQWLAIEKCVLYYNHTTKVVANNNMICKGRLNRPFVLDTALLSQRPPNIASLLSTITKAPIDSSIDESLREVLRQQQKADYDYSQESWMTWGILRTHHQPKVEETNPSLGFRRNPNKNPSKHSNAADASKQFPMATYFWLLLNVGLYGWYYSKHVDSKTVSLNGQLLRNGGDFGRALSGNLAHFEVWHLGVNGMSLIHLGQALEKNTNLMGGTIGLLLWTGSFLVLVAVCVVVLHIIDRHLGARLWRRGTGPSAKFPSMVGFSGVLFAWSVAWALSLSEFQQTCPLPFLCFSTHNLGGGFRFSWGPIVQLVFLQVLLHKKVSFVGHLAGTIVGFLWHWGMLPPLEWSQPCILYPVLWAVGKCAIHRWSSGFEALAGGSEDQGSRFGSSCHLGGGQVLGSGGSLWTLSNASPDEEESTLGKTALMYGVQRVLFLHALVQASVYGFRLLESMVLSELLLILVYVLFVRAVAASSGSPDERDHPLCILGVVGRAYIAFAVVAVVTDAMSIGGWLATLRWGETPWLVSVIVATRIPLWVISSSTVCLLLEFADELQVRDGGIWSHVLGWSVADPCLVLGKFLDQAKWRVRHPSTTTRIVPRQDSEEVTPGRTISNVAGKSRLLDRGTTSNRGVV